MPPVKLRVLLFACAAIPAADSFAAVGGVPASMPMLRKATSAASAKPPSDVARTTALSSSTDDTTDEEFGTDDSRNGRNGNGAGESSADRPGASDELGRLDMLRQEFEKQFRDSVFTTGDHGHLQSDAVDAGCVRNGGDRQRRYPGSAEKEECRVVTQSRLRLMELETRLLESMLTSDDAVDTLMDLWVQETHDANITRALNSMEVQCSPGFSSEVDMLLQWIANQPDWAEPKSRLALIRYYQDDFTSSIDLCKQVLATKPWQFEAAQTLVWNALRIGDLALAVSTARTNTLPPLSQPKRRRRWVNRALLEARFRLSEATLLHRSQHRDVGPFSSLRSLLHTARNVQDGNDGSSWQ